MKVIEFKAMSEFNAVGFAEWLDDCFQKSSFKTYAELGNAVKKDRNTISALAKARPQSATGKPSRPKRDLVIELANALNADPNPGLAYCSYAPVNIEISEHEKELLRKYNQLSPKNQTTIETLIDQLLERLTEPNMQFPAKFYRQAPLEETDDEMQKMRS